VKTALQKRGKEALIEILEQRQAEVVVLNQPFILQEQKLTEQERKHVLQEQKSAARIFELEFQVKELQRLVYGAKRSGLRVRHRLVR